MGDTHEEIKEDVKAEHEQSYHSLSHPYTRQTIEISVNKDKQSKGQPSPGIQQSYSKDQNVGPGLVPESVDDSFSKDDHDVLRKHHIVTGKLYFLIIP